MTQPILLLEPWLGLAEAFATKCKETKTPYLIVSDSNQVAKSIENIDKAEHVNVADIRTKIGLRNAFATALEKHDTLAHIVRIIQPSPSENESDTHVYGHDSKILQSVERTLHLAAEKLKATHNLFAISSETQVDADGDDADSDIDMGYHGASKSTRASVSILFPTRFNNNLQKAQNAILRRNLSTMIRYNAPVLAAHSIACNLYCVERVLAEDLALKSAKVSFPQGRPANDAEIIDIIFNFSQPSMSYISGQTLFLNGGAVE